MIRPPTHIHDKLAALAAVALSLTLGGCLERVERITISPDGSAVLKSQFHGTPDDFKRSADALPEPGAAWAVTDMPSKNDKGEDELTRVATLNVAPGGALPDTYAAPQDPRSEFSLKFPTDIRLRRVGGQAFCDFSRTYVRREEAPFTYAKRLLSERPEGKKLVESDPTTLNDAELAQAVGTFASLEADKQAQFVAAAGREMESKGLWTQDAALRIRTALFDAAAGFDRAPIIALLRQPPSPNRDAAIAKIGTNFDAALDLTITRALGTLQIPDSQGTLFYAGLARARSMRAATEDLADEKWEVRVHMPGQVVAHNADAVDGDDLVWRFDASALEDRDQVLRATSVLNK